MTRDFEGQRAVVTGGTRGIGAAIARELLARGATVIVTGRPSKPDDADPSLALDFRPVLLEDECAVDQLARELASEEIDVLVNNAGGTVLSPVEKLSVEDWDRVQAVNLRAPFLLCRALAPAMARRGYGRIVNVASVFAEVTRCERAAYAASKAGLVGLTRTLAVEYAAQGVLVNAVGPGFIDTELTRTALPPDALARRIAEVPIGRLGQPEEIARVVAFLASRANGLITGQHLIADGGFTLL